MPYKDPQKKAARMREWRDEKIKDGYGRWLYARRKLVYDDAKRFREALEQIADASRWNFESVGVGYAMSAIADTALIERREAEEALGPFKKEAADE